LCFVFRKPWESVLFYKHAEHAANNRSIYIPKVQMKVQWTENRMDEQKLKSIFENNFKNAPLKGLP